MFIPCPAMPDQLLPRRATCSTFHGRRWQSPVALHVVHAALVAHLSMAGGSTGAHPTSAPRPMALRRQTLDSLGCRSKHSKLHGELCRT